MMFFGGSPSTLLRIATRENLKNLWRVLFTYTKHKEDNVFSELGSVKKKLVGHKREERRLLKVQQGAGVGHGLSQSQADRLLDLQTRIIPENEREIQDLENGVGSSWHRNPVRIW